MGWKSKEKREFEALRVSLITARSQSAWTREAPLLVMETSELALPWRVTTSAFLTVKEIPPAGTDWPLTLPVPETICPSITFEASVDLIVHFNVMAEPKGFGML